MQNTAKSHDDRPHQETGCILVKMLIRVDWGKLGKCQKVIQHTPEGGLYFGVAVNSEGLLAVTDDKNNSIHLLRKYGALVRSIGKGMLGVFLHGITFDLKKNLWVADEGNNKVLKLSQDGRLLQTIDHAGSIRVTISTILLVCLSAQKVWFTSVIVATTVSLSMMQRACFCLLLGQREVALGVLMYLVM